MNKSEQVQAVPQVNKFEQVTGIVKKSNSWTMTRFGKKNFT